MKDRIIQFLAAENISPAEFADKIGVQRSSMSHILNGRNYPSASFLQKMLQAYPALNPRWLMIGDGTMNFESHPVGTLASVPDFHDEEPELDSRTALSVDQQAGIPFPSDTEPRNIPPVAAPEVNHTLTETKHFAESVVNQSTSTSGEAELQKKNSVAADQSSAATSGPSNGKEIEQVLFFYKDKTFSVYRPS